MQVVEYTSSVPQIPLDMFDIDPPSRSSKIGEVESNNLSKTSFKKDETASYRANQIMSNQIT